MSKLNNWMSWTLLGTLIIPICCFIGLIVELIIHGSFGYTMKDDGNYLSNAIMAIGGGAIFGFGIGTLQKLQLRNYIKLSNLWVLSMIVGFTLAELIAGVILWKFNIYRGLINFLNNDSHYTEALIYALAGFITGILQYRLLKPFFKKSYLWVIASTLGWGVCILITYVSIWAFILGASFYSAITGYALYMLMEPKDNNSII
jgi:hypothetical protein